MHIYLAKSSRFESTDFASVMIDDVGCSRRHQCPQCGYGQSSVWVTAVTLKKHIRNKKTQNIFPKDFLQTHKNVIK